MSAFIRDEEELLLIKIYDCSVLASIEEQVIKHFIKYDKTDADDFKKLEFVKTTFSEGYQSGLKNFNKTHLYFCYLYKHQSFDYSYLCLVGDNYVHYSFLNNSGRQEMIDDIESHSILDEAFFIKWNEINTRNKIYIGHKDVGHR